MMRGLEAEVILPKLDRLVKVLPHIDPTPQGKIEIYFTPSVNYPSISAIEVIPEWSGPPKSKFAWLTTGRPGNANSQLRLQFGTQLSTAIASMVFMRFRIM
jgi:hypothetical protein